VLVTNVAFKTGVRRILTLFLKRNENRTLLRVVLNVILFYDGLRLAKGRRMYTTGA